MVVLADSAFHAKVGDPANLKLCQRGSGTNACWWKQCFPCSPWFGTSRR
jgi:hypothetical protein